MKSLEREEFLSLVKEVDNKATVSDVHAKLYLLDKRLAKSLIPKEHFKCLEGLEKLAVKQLRDLTLNYAKSGLPAVISLYRKSLGDLNNKSFFYKFFRPSTEVMEELAIERSHAISGIVIREIAFPLVERIVDKSLSISFATSYVKKCAALLLLTGRRPIEVLKTGNFELCEKPFSVFFEGQAKKRGAGDKYEIPVLTDPKFILSLHNSLRRLKDFSEKKEHEVHNACSKELSLCVKREFSHLIGIDCTPYSLRSLYVAICEYRIKPNNPSSFRSRILGHNEEDLTTQRSYERFRIC